MNATSLTKPTSWGGVSRKTYPSWGDRELRRLMHPYLENYRGGHLLEIGCGNSYWLPYFVQEYSYSVAGIDFSATRLEQAERNLSRRGFTGDLVCASLESHPLPDRKFDLVVSFGFVEHFDQPSEALRLCSQYLAPGGRMITTIPHLSGFWGRLGRRLNPEASMGYREMNMEGAWRAHLRANLRIVSRSYLRWLDPGILNWGNFPRPIQATAGVLSTLIANAASTSPWKGESLCVDMIIVSKTANTGG